MSITTDPSTGATTCANCGRTREFATVKRREKWKTIHSRGCTARRSTDRDLDVKPRELRRPPLVRWTEAEDNAAAISRSLAEALEELPGRKAAAIHARRTKLGKRGVTVAPFKRPPRTARLWTDDERIVAAALDSYDDISTLLPGRSRAAIDRQRLQMTRAGRTVAFIGRG